MKYIILALLLMPLSAHSAHNAQHESPLAGLFDEHPSLHGQTPSHSKVSNVPVPAAVWLFGSGLVGLALLSRRK